LPRLPRPIDPVIERHTKSPAQAKFYLSIICQGASRKNRGAAISKKDWKSACGWATITPSKIIGSRDSFLPIRLMARFAQQETPAIVARFFLAKIRQEE
jgi:hypothetical protein